MISVIITNYNRKDEIKQLAAMLYDVRSLICELIIVDDASTVNLDIFYDHIQKTYDDLIIRIIRNALNKGPAASRNIGITLAKGDMLLLIDSDVYCSPDCVRKLYERINNYDIAFPAVMYDDGTRKNPQKHHFNKEHCMDSAMFMVKKESLRKMDMGFDEDIRVGEDFDFFLRAYAFGLKAEYVNDAVAYHPVHRCFTADQLRADVQYPLYARLKMMGMCKFHIPWIVTIGILLVRHLIGVLSGKRIALFSDIKPVSYSSTRSELMRAYGNAIAWNLSRYQELCEKRRKLRRAIIQCKKQHEENDGHFASGVP